MFEEYEFIVLHVLFRVRLEVGPKLMQIQAVSVVTFLIVEEELTKLRCAERGSNHAIVQHELVYGEYCDGTLASRMKSEVRGVGGTSSGRVVNVFSIDDNFLQVAILTEILN